MARRSCILCGQKHLAQAMVLLDESLLGYPIHRVLAFGHMAEAESELLDKYFPLAEKIRNERIKAMEDKSYQPVLLEILEMLYNISDIPTA